MRVVQAQIQTVEKIYRLVWTAVENKQPIEAMYQERLRLFCPHRLRRNRQDGFAYSAINTAGKAGVDSNRRARLQTGVVLHWRNSAG
jgi:hypothetical protein